MMKIQYKFDNQPPKKKNVKLKQKNTKSLSYVLVGGFNPSKKYARQTGSFPQFSGWKFQKNGNHNLAMKYHPLWHTMFAHDS